CWSTQVPPTHERVPQQSFEFAASLQGAPMGLQQTFSGFEEQVSWQVSGRQHSACSTQGLAPTSVHTGPALLLEAALAPPCPSPPASVCPPPAPDVPPASPVSSPSKSEKSVQPWTASRPSDATRPSRRHVPTGARAVYHARGQAPPTLR